MRGKNLRFGEKRYADNWEMGAAFTKFPWGVHPSLIPLGSRGLAYAGLSSFDDINAAYPTDAMLAGAGIAPSNRIASRCPDWLTVALGNRAPRGNPVPCASEPGCHCPTTVPANSPQAAGPC